MAQDKNWTVNYRARYNLDYKPGEDALQYYRRLAKVADQRLVRLEEIAGEREGIAGVKGFENATAYAYARAMTDIDKYSEGRHRFNTKPPLNTDGTVNDKLLNMKIKDIKTFLLSASSTKAGIQESYEKRAKYLNEKYHTNYSWQEMADYFQSGDYKKHNKDYGSETIFKALGVIKRAESIVLKDIDQNKKKYKSNKVEVDVALEMLKNSKTSLWKKYSNEERAALRKELKAQR